MGSEVGKPCVQHSSTKDSKPSPKQDNLGHWDHAPPRGLWAPHRPFVACWLGREGADRIRNPTGLGAFLPKSSQRTEDYSMKIPKT